MTALLDASRSSVLALALSLRFVREKLTRSLLLSVRRSQKQLARESISN